MSVERDIRYDLIARLCPNATGAELKSVATEVSCLRLIAGSEADGVGGNVCYPSEKKGRDRERLPRRGGEGHPTGYQVLKYCPLRPIQLDESIRRDFERRFCVCILCIDTCCMTS